MTLHLAESPPRLTRTIVQRTRGHSHGPITRLVSPSDLGRPVKHPHDLALGDYSVHTNQHALERGEATIGEIGRRLREQGRL